MKVGSLIRSVHDHQLRGIVMELGPAVPLNPTCGDGVVKVSWIDGDLTCEFVRMLEVLSEPTH